MERSFEDIIQRHRERDEFTIRYSLYTLAWCCDNWRIRNAAAEILAFGNPDEWDLDRFEREFGQYAEMTA